ncbi:MAG: hypothetical protein U1A27_12820 [Phycisphaerae bacterium]
MDSEAPLPPDERPLEQRVPEPIVATPRDLPAAPDDGGEPPWWRPTIRDLAAHLGWRWVLLAPIAGLVLFAALVLVKPSAVVMTFPIGFHLAWFSGAVGISLAGYLVRVAVRARREPFCIHCGYTLTGLPDGHRCPECGRPFSLRVIEEYRRDPRWFIERYRAGRQMPRIEAPFNAGPVQRPPQDGTS